MDEKLNLRWGVERKLEFIEFRLFWEGYVNRGDIIDTFRWRRRSEFCFYSK